MGRDPKEMKMVIFHPRPDPPPPTNPNNFSRFMTLSSPAYPVDSGVYLLRKCNCCGSRLNITYGLGELLYLPDICLAEIANKFCLVCAAFLV